MSDPEITSGKEPIVARVIATWFGTGDLPRAPGTWGSLAALPFALLLVVIGGQMLLAAGVLIAFFAGIWSSARLAEFHGLKDPQRVVIDEVAGQWLAILPVAYDWRFYLVAFVLFRLFDITKPWPLRRLEKLPGGVGIMADDIGAGVIAGILVWMIAIFAGTARTIPILVIGS